MAFVGVFWSLDNIDQFANPLFDGAYFPECNVVFVGLEKDFIARIESFLWSETVFLDLACRGMSLSKTDSREHCFCRRASHRRVRIRGYPIHLQKPL